MHSPTEEIKAKLDVVDIIGTYAHLTRAGANFKACCPFHSEKTPSFMVSRAKQLWYCFGACNEGGDIFKFMMKIEGLDFPEALKLLADKAGVVLPKYDARVENKKNTLLEIMKTAVDFYAEQLRVGSGLVPDRGGAQGPALQGAKDAWQYLQKRGLTKDVIAQFKLGYAPDSWDALALAFRDKFKPEDIFAAGLSIAREKNQGFYDRFRHRIMFPIRDIHGNPVGFTSRIMDEKRAEGKYVNTPETPVYTKSRILYGLDAAREAIRKQDYAIAVEGNMDVIACHQFGMTNVVAASGTAFTLEHVRLLKRYTNNLMICFDADAAGQTAAKRGIDIALSEGMRVKVVVLPEGCGKDPGDCVRKNLKAWRGAVRGAREIMEYYIEKARARYDVKTSSGRTQFVNMLLAEIRKLPDLIEQDFWIKRVSEIARVDEKILREQMGHTKGLKVEDRVSSEKDTSYVLPPTSYVKTRLDLLSERLLALMLASPENIRAIIDTIMPEMLSPSDLHALYINLVSCYTAYNQSRPPTGATDFRQFWRNWATSASVGIVSEMLSTADILELLGDKEFEGWDATQFGRETGFLISEIRRAYTTKRRDELASAMQQAERAGDAKKVSQLTEEFGELKDSAN